LSEIDPWTVRRSRSLLLAWGLCGMFLLSSTAHASVFVTGSDLNGLRSTGGGGLFGTGGWDNGNLTLSWDIEQLNATPGFEEWSYTYTFSSNGSPQLAKGLSHWILEVSPSIVPDNLHSILYGWNPSDLEDVITLSDSGGWSPDEAGGENPGLPGSIYGIKFDFGSDDFEDGEFAAYSFLSTRAPIWGNVYGKGGKDNNGTIDMYFYNEGFTNPATEIPQASSGPDTWLNWIATPDTVSSPPPIGGDDSAEPVVPEPSGIVLAGLGVLSLVGYGYRRHRQKG
jgi:hypothetical protein